MAHLVSAVQKPGFDPWFGKIPWRRERLPTPVFWPGELHGLSRPSGRKESDMTERLALHMGRGESSRTKEVNVLPNSPLFRSS